MLLCKGVGPVLQQVKVAPCYTDYGSLAVAAAQSPFLDEMAKTHINAVSTIWNMLLILNLQMIDDADQACDDVYEEDEARPAAAGSSHVDEGLGNAVSVMELQADDTAAAAAAQCSAAAVGDRDVTAARAHVVADASATAAAGNALRYVSCVSGICWTDNCMLSLPQGTCRPQQGMHQLLLFCLMAPSVPVLSVNCPACHADGWHVYVCAVATLQG